VSKQNVSFLESKRLVLLPDSGLFGADGSSEEGRLAVLECKQPICLTSNQNIVLHKDQKFG
jgi:hypothetical protein